MANPYIIDRPLTDHDWFVGREKSFTQLLQFLTDGDRMLLLCGRRYSGKTSFINQLPNVLREGYRLAYINWDSMAESEDPFWELLAAISDITKKPMLDTQSYRDNPYVYGLNYLKLVCGQGTRNVTLFCLDSLSIESLHADGKWETVITTLQDILASLPSAAFLVVAEGHPLGITSHAIAALPQIAFRPLDEQEVEDLVGVPARSTLVYDYELIRQIGGLAGGDPYLVQIIAKLLYDNRGTASWLGPNAIDTIGEPAQELASPAFEALWEEATPQARTMIAAFAAMTGHHGVGSVEDVALYLHREHIQAPKTEIEKTITYLADRDYLVRLGGGVLQFKSELFRLWLRHNHPLMDVIDEYHLYRRTRARKPAPWKLHNIDWVGIGLWVAAVALVAGIIVLWQSRSTGLFRMTHFNVSKQTAIPTAGTGAGTPILTNIVYQGKLDSSANWHIYIMRSDGSDVLELTTGEQNDTNPVLSPDGQKIAFVSDRDGNREIYVMGIDGSNPVNLTRNVAEDWTPAWSPDGRYIAFASFRDSNWELYVMNADGSRPARLTDNVSSEYSPAWSPDGKSLVYVSDRDGNLEIYSRKLEATEEQRLTDNPATDQSPAWSPDGRLLAWASYRDGNMEIYVANADGTNPQNVTEDPISDDQGPSWASDNQQIVFYSNRDHGWDIYTLEITTGKRLNLTSSQAFEQLPNWGK
ncbi:MAG: DPP IV N-terminal domain-containing protein [Chloroflexi bacterium]|nr:DPP IV N-terminal domain-containing protein [Chloroflexota bacterium]